jgi:hypothetical protein
MGLIGKVCACASEANAAMHIATAPGMIFFRIGISLPFLINDS